jgi:hypothetical protein
LADDGIENIANLIYASRSTRKIRFWKAENIQPRFVCNETCCHT